MGLWRRRRKTALSALALTVVAGGALIWWQRRRVQGYVPGDATAGLTDQLAADRPAGMPPVRLVDVGEAAGLDFEHFPGKRTGSLPEDMGSGVACGDVDGDGWTDLFLVGSGPLGAGGRSRLYRNRGDGTFEDVTSASGVEVTAVGQAAAFVDVDGDGDLDLFVTTYGTCRLFENDGAGRFCDRSARAGLEDLPGFWTGIGVADFDVDGAMDLYVCGYVEFDPAVVGDGSGRQFGLDIPAGVNPSGFPPTRNLLLRGRGDGTFTDVAAAAGVDDALGKGLGVLFCDLDGDRLPDLYVANDVSDNALFLNRGDGTFADHTALSQVGDYRGAMGLAAADFDEDRDLDLFITHWVAQENALYEARRRSSDDGLLYRDVADQHGLGYVGLRQVGWATRFLDLDGDGTLDLFVVNGSTIPTRDDPSLLTPMRSQLFWQEPGSRRFHEVGAAGGAFWDEPHVGRGGASLDYDLDGDEDLVVCLHGERVRLLRNEGGEARGFVRLRLRQPSGNTHAVGARVEVERGGRTFVDVVDTQGSYLSQHTVGELTFGLGDDAWLDRVRVTWPDGTRDEAGPFFAGVLVTWTRGGAPRVAALPGREPLVQAGPADVAQERAFFRARDRATRLRVAGDLEQAVGAYGAALSLWPGHADALYYLAGCWLGQGREPSALAALETLVAFEPRSSAAWMLLGRLRLPGGDPGLDDLALARAAFERSHALNGEESGPVEALGVVALLEGDHDGARSWLADAAKLNPRSVRARYLGGRCAFLAGDEPEARRLLEEAHGLARDTGRDAGESVSNEGQTATGTAMTVEASVADLPLERWRTLAQRELVSPSEEYGGG